MTRLLDRVLDRLYVAYGEKTTDLETERGIVSFSFDDFPASAFHNAAPILEDAGWRGTYYTCGGLLGAESGSGTLASAEEVNDCLARGHEIANHTLSHCNCSQSDAATIRREIADNSAALPAAATKNFAFPFGAANIRERRIAKDLVATARGVQHGINGRETLVKDLLANPIYTDTGLDKLYSLIAENSQKQGWLIFYTHDVTDDPSPFGCTQEDFSVIVAAVASIDMEVLTVEQARQIFLQGAGV